MKRTTAAMLAMLAALIGAPASGELDTAPAGEAGAAPAPAEDPEALAAEAQAPPAGRVERGNFTTTVVDLEPQDSIRTLSNLIREVVYFSEIRGAPGETITHRWEWSGKPMAEVSFDVEARTVTSRAGTMRVRIPEGARLQLLEGTWNATAVLLEAGDAIEATAARLPYLSEYRST